MLISLKSLINSPEGKKTFEYSIDLSAEKVNHEFPFQTPVVVSGTLVDKSGAVFFDATACYALNVHCLRCNKPVQVEQQTEAHFLLSMESDRVDGVDDIYYLDSDGVDTDAIIVPEIFMSVDMAYLCGEECKGLCPVCGCDRNTETCACVTKELDPRMAKLAQLL